MRNLLTFKKILPTCALLMLPVLGYSGQIYNTFSDIVPDTVSAADSYVFYSHGFIVEGDNPTPVDTRFGWGKYDFPAVKKALSDESYHLIAFHRPKNTNPRKYAYELNKQVRELIKQGVKPTNITLIGFSRGAFITGLTSDKLSDIGVNTIILAGCGRLVHPGHSDTQVYGHVLSIYEESDRANTCVKLKEKSPLATSFTEIKINTGLSHGAFYRPLDVWVKPIKKWIKKLNK